MSSSSIRPASLLAASLTLEADASAVSATARLATGAASPAPPRPGHAPRRLSSETLLADRREVEIEHAGQVYRLRLTSLGKLILTK
ncbi:hemin uptake protein HemP [Roseateles sp.]|jgi:hemin uptake protein HemP|uniref:hemin uptake protein HemP n=1 Tax=Roseateles sp. TaxID=1971397 RepID=UPI003D0F8378